MCKTMRDKIFDCEMPFDCGLCRDDDGFCTRNNSCSGPALIHETSYPDASKWCQFRVFELPCKGRVVMEFPFGEEMSCQWRSKYIDIWWPLNKED